MITLAPHKNVNQTKKSWISHAAAAVFALQLFVHPAHGQDNILQVGHGYDPGCDCAVSGKVGGDGLDVNLEEQFAALTGSDFSMAGYVDSAAISTHVRFRYDVASDADRSDRAEYMFSTWQAFGGELPNPPDGAPDPDLNWQTISLYYERALTPRFSLFVEMPIMFTDPSDTRNEDEGGLGDMIVGFKWAVVEGCNSRLTFQLKNYIPTGNAEKWLGTGHYSIEPGLLYSRSVGNCWLLEAEVRDWISIGGSVVPDTVTGPNTQFIGDNYAGNVLRYGVALSYKPFDPCDGCGCGWAVSPVLEFVGWSVLDGLVFNQDAGELADASGDTIVNVKIGARIGMRAGRDIYVGYGHALTGDRWYRDTVRAEYRITF